MHNDYLTNQRERLWPKCYKALSNIFPINLLIQGAARFHLVWKTSALQTAICQQPLTTIITCRPGMAGWTTGGHGALKPTITISGSKWVLWAWWRRQELLPKGGRMSTSGWRSILSLTVQILPTSASTKREEELRYIEWFYAFAVLRPGQMRIRVAN